MSGKTTTNEAYTFIDVFDQTILAGIDTCNDWIEQMPDSYAAHWACGAKWRQGAWDARTGEFADKVTPIRFALMRERFANAAVLLEKAITLEPKPIEALTLLASTRRMLKDDDGAEALLNQAQALMPADRPLHEARLNYALPEWGGSQEQVEAAMATAKKAGLDADVEAYLFDTTIGRPWKTSAVGSEKMYWEKAIAERPTRARLRGLTTYYQQVENWRDSIPATSRLISQYPDDADAYAQRAHAYSWSGDPAAALADYRMAAALGNDKAIQALIDAHLQGRLGLPPKDWPALDKVCRYGAALGSPAAMNCVASALREGVQFAGPDGPFHTDLHQSLAWHLRAARAGHSNSQHDLGWLLMTGAVAGVEGEKASDNGLFWLRRAAENSHKLAEKKLQQGGHEVIERVASNEDESLMHQALTVASRLMQLVLF